MARGDIILQWPASPDPTVNNVKLYVGNTVPGQYTYPGSPFSLGYVLHTVFNQPTDGDYFYAYTYSNPTGESFLSPAYANKLLTSKSTVRGS